MTDIINAMFDKLEDLFGGFTAQLTLAQSETNTQVEQLANALTRPIVTRPRVADRFSTGYLEAVPTDKPQRIIGLQPQRGSIAIRNLSEDTTDVVWVSSTPEAVRALGSPAFPLYGGQPLVIDTTAEVWVFAASGSSPAIGWVCSEFTIENAR